MISRLFSAVAAASLFTILVGCGASRQAAYLADTKPVTTTSTDAESVAARFWEKREDPTLLRKSLTKYEEVAKAQPDRRDILARLARGYYLLAYGYLQGEEEILAAHDTGASWGERILGLRPEFKKKIQEDVDDDEALSVVKKEDVPGIYWAYSNLGRWSVMKGFTTVLKNKSKLKAFVSRVAELDPTYFYGAGDRGLAAFYAKAPSFAGGDMDLAKKHFDKSLKIEPNYFGTKVLMAEFYAVKNQDRKLFDKLLNEVLSDDPMVIPEIAAIQKVEQKKAKKLLANGDDLFE